MLGAGAHAQVAVQPHESSEGQPGGIEAEGLAEVMDVGEARQLLDRAMEGVGFWLLCRLGWVVVGLLGVLMCGSACAYAFVCACMGGYACVGGYACGCACG